MSLQVRPTALSGVIVFEPQVFGDDRGYFFEAWHADRYADAGLPRVFVQDNVSKSARGVVRGLHFQEPRPQGKLVQVIDGEIFDVAVDIRVGSPTFGRWVGEVLSSSNRRQIYVGPGFAHGFCVTSEFAVVHYKCTEFYDPSVEASVKWNDPDIGVRWPLDDVSLSAKDAAALRLADLPRTRLPQYRTP